VNVSIKRQDDNLLRIDVTSTADDWGTQRGIWRTTSTDNIDSITKQIGSCVVEFLGGVPPRKPPRDESGHAMIPLNLGPVSAGEMPAPGGEIGSGSILAAPDETPATSGANIRKMLDTAILTQRNVVIRYTDRHEATTERVIEPKRIERKRYGGQVFPQDYLLAYDPEQDSVRSFKLERISRVEWAS
jgi:WYL domain